MRESGQVRGIAPSCTITKVQHEDADLCQERHCTTAASESDPDERRSRLARRVWIAADPLGHELLAISAMEQEHWLTGALLNGTAAREHDRAAVPGGDRIRASTRHGKTRTYGHLVMRSIGAHALNAL